MLTGGEWQANGQFNNRALANLKKGEGNMIIEVQTLIIIALIFFIIGLVAGVSLTRPNIRT